MSEEMTRREASGAEEELLPPDAPDAAEGETAKPSYQPAGPVKRALAWIGVVYMVILVALNLYAVFTGTALRGLAPLLAVPGLIGLGITALIARSTGRLTATAAWMTAVVCWLLAAWMLLPGIAGLMGNFT